MACDDVDQSAQASLRPRGVQGDKRSALVRTYGSISLQTAAGGRVSLQITEETIQGVMLATWNRKN